MMKLLLLLAFTLTLNAEYAPKKVTKNDLQRLNAIDEKLYSLAMKKEHFNYEKVANFVYKNLAYDLDFSRFKVVGTGTLRKTKYLTANPITNRGDMARAGLVITYPFFDAKENNARLEKMVSVKQKIIADTKAYFKLKAAFEDLELQKLILLQVETRAKARKLQAVGSFDDWLKVINSIRKINAELELSDAKQTLVSYVMKEKMQQLKNML